MAASGFPDNAIPGRSEIRTALGWHGVIGGKNKLNKGIFTAGAVVLAMAAVAAVVIGRNGSAAAYIDPSDAAMVSRGKPIYT